MDLSVEYVLNQILEKLIVEDESLEINFSKNVGFDENVSRNSLKNIEEFSEIEITGLSQKRPFSDSNLFFSEIHDANGDFKKLNIEDSATGNSSELGDLSAIKSIYNDSTNECILKKNLTITRSEEFELGISQTSETLEKAPNEIQRIITSTPKKYKRCDSSVEDSLKYYTDDSLSEWVAREKNDYLNITIDQAIEKYEEKEEQFKNVSVQTDSGESTKNLCNCSANSEPKKDKNLSFQDSLDSPPLKKIKKENKPILTAVKGEKILRIMNLDTEKDEIEAFCSTKTEGKIGNKLPISVSTVISVGKENFGFSKVPRIRVGLSKRIKPRKLNNF